MSILRSLRSGSVLLWVGLMASPACSGNVSRGHALYAEGYYVEAAEVFERSERRLSEWPPDKRAQYGLYRGMTLLELGDLQGAGRWLAYAQWVSSEHPGVLPTREAALLAESQHALHSRLGRAPFDAHGHPVMATSASPAAPVLAPPTAQPPPRPDPPETRKSFAE